MKCSICKIGETESGNATVTLERGETTIVIKNVPAQVCGNCGEYYLTEAITEQITRLAEEAVVRGVQVEVLTYAASVHRVVFLPYQRDVPRTQSARWAGECV